MASIKISELNSLDKADKEDLLVIVDTSDDETKKIAIEDLNIGSTDVVISPEQPTGEDWKLWIDSDEVQNLGSEVVDTLDGNETTMAPSVRAIKEGLKGKYLWVNPNPTEAIAYQHRAITLSSSDYDVLEFYFYTGTDNKFMTVQKTMAGHGVVGMYINGYSGLMYGRNITYESKTVYTINECYRYGAGATTPPSGSNNYLIPAYVIGYKDSFNPIATATSTLSEVTK